jgi:PAS domain S-box-containing protein
MLTKFDKSQLLKKINSLISSYSRIIDIKSLAEEVQAFIDEFINFESSGLYLYDFKEGSLKLLVATGFTEEEKVEAERTAMERHPGWVFRNKKILHIPDVDSDTLHLSVESKRSFKVLSRLYIPVMDGEEAVGAFGIVSSERNKFTEDDISILTTIGTISGSVYGNLLKMENLRKANMKIVSLSKFTTENPHPVFRIGYDRKLWYANLASNDLLSFYHCQVGTFIRDKFIGYMNEVISSGNHLEVEIPANDKIYSLIFNPQPTEGYINVYGRDITERKIYEVELKRISHIAEETDNAIIVTNKDGLIEWVNKGFTKMTGYSLEEVIGKIPGKLLTGKDTDQEIVRMIQQATRNRESIEKDVLSYKKDGKPFWAKIQLQPIFDAKGEFINYFSIQRDITDQKKTEESLKRSEEKIRKIIDSAHDVIVTIDEHAIIQNWNAQAELIFGWTKDEAIGKMLIDLIIPQEIKRTYLRSIDRFFKTGDMPGINRRIEIIGMRKDGESFPIDLAISPIIFQEEITFSVFMRDVSSQKKAERELRSISSRLTALLKGLQEGILVEDEHRKIALTNMQFCKMFNVPVAPEMLNGLDCDETARQSRVLFNDPEEFIERVEVILNGKEAVTGDELLLTDGRVFERDYTPIMLEDKFMGNLWQYRDISERKKNVLEISRSRQEAESASIAKGRFLANMSHEIRTPLNAIIGLVGLLKDTSLSQGQNKLAESLVVSANNLLRIINDILDFSKIESGQVNIEYTNFSLPKLFDGVFSTLRHMAEEKGLVLNKIMDLSIVEALKGDSLRLQQVMTNLVSNAIKFTQDGEVSLQYILLERSEESYRIRFEVRDTGIGISKENLGRIFESFQQADESTTRKFGGTGLGLAISKQLVELMGGKLQVISSIGEGSTFSFVLDLEIGDSSLLESIGDNIAISATALKGKNILVVEDNQFNQFIVRSMLENWGAAVGTADNGFVAVEMVKKGEYDLVLMDKQMPVMDGIEATKIIRRKLKSAVPIIALTADVLKEVIQNCLDAGMNDYIAKPFEPENLFRRIVKLLGIVIDKDAVSNMDKDSPKPRKEEKLYDFSRLNRMLGSEEQQLKIMVEKFLVITPAYIAELNRALRDKDFEAMEKISHKLKASIDLIASDELKEDIRAIHDISRNKKDIEKLESMVDKFTGLFETLLGQLSLQNQN